MTAFLRTLKDIRRYPSAIVGIAIILVLVIIAIYAMVTIPYEEAVRLWRGGEEVWYDSPKNAGPVWTNLFRKNKLPTTMVMSTLDGSVEKSHSLPGSPVARRTAPAWTM